MDDIEHEADGEAGSSMPAVLPAAATTIATNPTQSKIEAVSLLLSKAIAKASDLRLTADESKALKADFPDEAFRKGAAGKDNLIYIEHAHLRSRLDDVLGMGQAVLVPRSQWREEFTYFKDRQEKTGVKVYVQAMLVVRGCYITEAVGEMTYYPGNQGADYSDAVEGAETAAFRRCCKKFGIGLQAWSKTWCEGWWRRKGTQTPTNGNQQGEDRGYEDHGSPMEACPKCGKTDSVIQGKAEYGGGLVCLLPETPILYADFVWRPIGDAKIGDVVFGFDEHPTGFNVPRKFRPSVIQELWHSSQQTKRLITQDAEIVTTAQHRWLRHHPERDSRDGAWLATERLRIGSGLRNIGFHEAPLVTDDYRCGYLAGMTLGDGTMRFTPGQTSTKPSVAYWRVALKATDEIALGRLVSYLANFGVESWIRPFNSGPGTLPNGNPKPECEMKKVEVRALGRLSIIHSLIQTRQSAEFKRGFLAGFFDAEGSGGDHFGVYQNDESVLGEFNRYAACLGFQFSTRKAGTDGAFVSRMRGTMLDRLRFLSVVQPALSRKAGLYGVGMRHDPSRVLGIEQGPMRDVVDIQTSTGTFFAAGIATHNCFKKKNGGCGHKWGGVDTNTGQAAPPTVEYPPIMEAWQAKLDDVTTLEQINGRFKTDFAAIPGKHPERAKIWAMTLKFATAMGWVHSHGEKKFVAASGTNTQGPANGGMPPHHAEVLRQFNRIGTSENTRVTMMSRYGAYKIEELAEGPAKMLIQELVKIASKESM